MGDRKLTFVLPLRGARDTLAARWNLLPSIDRFFDVGDIEEILVIGRSDEQEDLVFNDVVSAQLAERIHSYAEQEILPRNRSLLPLRGYDRQGIIKLAIGDRIRTGLYCTLDSDMYLVRPCGLSEWLLDGKCIYNPCSMDIHPHWWRASAKHLGYAFDFDRTHGFDVTPALLYTDIVKEVVRYLKTDRKGLVHAIRYRATEYCLYWLYLLKNYRWSDLYHDGGPHLYGNCLWKRTDAEPNGVFELIDRQFSCDGSYYFSILQSTSRLADRRVLEYIHAKIVAGARCRTAKTFDSSESPRQRSGTYAYDHVSVRTSPLRRR